MQMPSGSLTLYARIAERQWQTVKGYAKRAITIKSEKAHPGRESCTAVLRDARIAATQLLLACGTVKDAWRKVYVAPAMITRIGTKKTALRICGARESMVGVIVGNRQLAPSK